MKKIALFASAVCGLAATSVALADGMTVRANAAYNGAFFKNTASYPHAQNLGLQFDTSGLSRAPVIVASETTVSDPANETGGFFANANAAVIWSTGTGVSAPSNPPAALLYILDEDAWSASDGDPYDDGAIKAYLGADGFWQPSAPDPGTAASSNITPLTGAMDVVQSLNGYSYEFVRSDEELQKGYVEPRRSTGVMAHELQQVLPAAVSSNLHGDSWINYSQITPVLIEAIKEQQAVIDELRERLDRLDGGGAPTQ